MAKNLIAIESIGPGYVEKLNSAGIEIIGDLLDKEGKKNQAEKNLPIQPELMKAL